MVQKAAWGFAIVFILIGVLGFVPGVTNDGLLLGIFEVDPLHNVIHLLTGLLAAFAAWKSASYAKLYFKVFGVVYAIVTIVGFVQGSTVLGLFGVNFADNLLHLVVALVALKFGFCKCKMCRVDGHDHGGGMEHNEQHEHHNQGGSPQHNEM